METDRWRLKRSGALRQTQVGDRKQGWNGEERGGGRHRREMDIDREVEKEMEAVERGEKYKRRGEQKKRWKQDH